MERTSAMGGNVNGLQGYGGPSLQPQVVLSRFNQRLVIKTTTRFDAFCPVHLQASTYYVILFILH